MTILVLVGLKNKLSSLGSYIVNPPFQDAKPGIELVELNLLSPTDDNK